MIMAKCAVCGKGLVFGKTYSHSHIRTSRKWKANIQKVTMNVNGVPTKISICTRCLRTAKLERA